MIFDATVGGRSLRVEVRAKDGRYTLLLDGEAIEADFQETSRGFASLIVAGRSYELGLHRRPGGYDVYVDNALLRVELAEGARGAAAPVRHASGPTKITAPMPGKIVRVTVEAGAEVQAGQGLLVMEAMKMENELRAPRAGRVREVHAREGQAVESGTLLIVVE